MLRGKKTMDGDQRLGAGIKDQGRGSKTTYGDKRLTYGNQLLFHHQVRYLSKKQRQQWGILLGAVGSSFVAGCVNGYQKPLCCVKKTMKWKISWGKVLQNAKIDYIRYHHTRPTNHHHWRRGISLTSQKILQEQSHVFVRNAGMLHSRSRLTSKQHKSDHVKNCGRFYVTLRVLLAQNYMKWELYEFIETSVNSYELNWMKKERGRTTALLFAAAAT